MTHLDKDDREEYTKLFLQVDNNGDGYIDKQELLELCITLGYKMTSSRLRALFTGLDKDGNYKVTLDEFLAVMPQINHKERKTAKLRRFFLHLDKNHDGFLSHEELQDVIKCQGVPLTEVKLKALLFQVDHNEDGKINYEEFLDLVHNFLR